MMMQRDDLLSKAPVTLTLDKAPAANKVLRNTYLLLAISMIPTSWTLGYHVCAVQQLPHWCGRDYSRQMRQRSAGCIIRCRWFQNL